MISGLPSGTPAAVTVSWVAGGFDSTLTASTSLSGLGVPGTYQITAANVTSGGTTYTPDPASQSAYLTAGSSVTKTVTYASSGSATTGNLAVTISGLPGGAAGAVTVSGPGGYSHALTGSATLSNLATGSYTITASTVSSGGTSYVPSPTSQTASVTAGATTTRTVSYTASGGGGGGSGSPATSPSTPRPGFR